MPFSFVEIEKQKSRSIVFAFLFIILVYFLTVYLLLLAMENVVFRSLFIEHCFRLVIPSLRQTTYALLLAFVVGIFHWGASTHNLTAKLLAAVDAVPIDVHDTYHNYFNHIVQEVSVAIGGRIIEPMVIRSASLNAFSVVDFDGKAFIGITEGLLAKLNRAHIESVVAHEAAHIASGDSLPATVLASVAEIYQDALTGIKAGLRSSRGRGSALLLVIYAVLSMNAFLSKSLRLFLSREREYRADANAVKLTRDPLSLAEALQLIAGGWRGSASSGEHIQSIFIMNPQHDELDEREGTYSEMFSTHPPLKKRVSVLLSMAHLDEKALLEHLKGYTRVSPVAKPEFVTDSQPVGHAWHIYSNGAWKGPFDINDARNMPDFIPTQWVRPEGQEQIIMAYEDEQLRALFMKESGQQSIE